MMCLGWRPKSSCYDAGAPASGPGGRDIAPCPGVGWFYLLAAGLALVGVMRRK
jgi:hypothetical protein